MEEPPARKLAVLLHADVVGSTALVRMNETLAHQRIRDAFRSFCATIARYDGIAHEVRGDALVAEFARGSDALSASLAFQVANVARNEELPDDLRPSVRVGIAMGEVVVADGTVTGEGVVLAQRLEEIAESDGVCIQGAAYETVPKRLPFLYENMGERHLKGFEEAVRVYRASLDPNEIVPPPEPSHRGPPQSTLLSEVPGAAPPVFAEKPSIAVLPFTNMSNDPEQEYFSDGLSEDIITDLALLPGLLVIARNSTFSYKGKAATTRQVGEELGVRYVLEGSVRKSNDRVRVTAQLVEAASGHHLWARRYDRSLEDVFDVQDELTREIITALDVELVQGERGKHHRTRLASNEAVDALYRGMAEYRKFDEPSHALAKRYFDEVTRIEPDSVVGYAWQAELCTREVFLGWGDGGGLTRMGEFVEKALSIDDGDPLTLVTAAVHQLFCGNHDRSIAYAERAVAEAPGMDSSYYTLGWMQMFNDMPREAVMNLRRSIRLHPTVTAPRLSILGTAYRNAGELDLAVSTLEATVERFPAFVSGRVALASCYGLMGRDEEARREVAEVLRLDPAYSIARYTSPNLYRNPDTMEKWAESLRRAGLPETSAP